MRILFVSDHDFLPDRVGGRESSIDELANMLIKRGHDITVLARTKTRNTRRPAGEIYWPILYEIERVTNVFGAAERYLASGRYDFAIYSAKKFSDNISTVEDIRRRQILYVRDATEIDDWDESTFQPSQVLIANSHFIAGRVQMRTGLYPHVVLPIVDFSKYRVKEIGGDVTFINPVRVKGMELAFAIAERNPEISFRFILCWDIETREIKRLENRAQSLGNVTMVEAQLDARPIYASSRMLMVPSQWEEGFGRVVLEAQCNGIPVIAAARGGIPEAVDDGGILLDGDAGVEEWSEALASLWNDQVIWQEMSKKAISRAENFLTEMEDNLVALETILGEILHRATKLQFPVPKCVAIVLPSDTHSGVALNSLRDQRCPHLDIIQLRQTGQANPDLDEAGDVRVTYRDLDGGESLSRHLFAILRETECAYVVLLRPGDLVDPEFIYALSNAHLNSLWTAAVAVCDAGVVNADGDVIVSSTSTFKVSAANNSKLTLLETYRDEFGVSALIMPWEVTTFERLQIGLMFRRDALLLLDNPPDFESIGELLAYLRFGAHLIGGAVYVDRVLCWSGVHGDALTAALPEPASGNARDDLWDVVIEQLVANDFTRHLKPANISKGLFGHLPKHRVLSLCERHPALREVLMQAFFDDVTTVSGVLPE